MNQTFSVSYRGQIHRAAKNHDLTGTARSTSADEIFARIRPYLERIRVTRIAEMTGMDRTGIPVFIALRPDARIPSLTFGKGMSREQARVSACMECLERYHGEVVDLPRFRRSHAELLGQPDREFDVIPFEQLLPCKNSFFHPGLALEWTLGWDIVNQREVAVPWEQVTLTPFLPPNALGAFIGGSNGLAAGGIFLEALAQALLEVIERDALTCHFLAAKAMDSSTMLRRVREDTIPFAPVRELLATIRQAGLEPLLHDCTVDTDVPVFECTIIDPEQPNAGLAKGFGASLDPAVAMLRAVTESALGRLEVLSGMRDNFPPHEFASVRMLADETLIRKMLDQPAQVDAADYRSAAGQTFEADVEILVSRLAGVGLERVVVFDITQPDMPVSIVRVVVPGLEGYHEFSYSRPGPRARTFARTLCRDRDHPCPY